MSHLKYISVTSMAQSYYEAVAPAAQLAIMIDYEDFTL